METVTDYSYGVVPLRKEAGEWKVFVLHQISRADTYWTFPKGHPEDGESSQEAALRELYEETGMVPAELDESRTFDHMYYFTHDDTRIEKHVSYFVGYIAEPAFTVQPEEVVEARWCTFDEAGVLLTYDLARELLDEVAEYVSNK